MEMLTDEFDDGAIGLKEMFDNDSLIDIGKLVKEPYTSARLVQAIELLHSYELTGLTPEEIKNDIRIHTEQWQEKLNESNKECEFWKRNCIGSTAQLGEIRIWLDQFKSTPEKVLEDCKTMFPDTK